MRSLKNLKEYHEERKRAFGCVTNYIYVTEHLPRELQQQQKRNFFRLIKKRNKTNKELREESKKQNIVYTLTM